MKTNNGKSSESGDGGIDGHGILQMNPFLSFKVHFQCKKENSRTMVFCQQNPAPILQGTL